MPRDNLPADAPASFADLSADKVRTIDEVCDCFEHQLYTRNGPTIECLMAGFQEPERSILLRELLFLELESCLSRDARPDRQRYFQRFPNHPAIVQQVLAELFPPAAAQPAASDDDGPPPVIPNYRILRKLGDGGMGSVYVAMHTGLGNLVAIKVLRANLASDLEAEVRFKREMKTVGSLAHPHIVQARDAGTAGNAPYLVMEYLDGCDLADLVERLGPLRVADACEIARQIALALQCAHQHQLVHRDIKPRNVLFGHSYGEDDTVQVKVADFGLALLRGHPRPHDPAISTGIVGTMTFMAPEQYWEQNSDIRSDIYSLGCTLYYLLVSRPPFSRVEYPKADQLMVAHRQAAVPPLRRLRPDVSESLERIILAMLAKDPHNRPKTPLDVAKQLEAFTTSHDLHGLRSEAKGSTDREPNSRPSEPLFPDDVSQTQSWIASPASPPSEPFTVPGGVTTAEPSSSPSSPPRAVVDSAPSQAAWPRRAALLSMAGLTATMLGVVAFRSLGYRRLEPVDLLKEVDLSRDAVSGDWQFRDEALVSPDAPQAKLVLRHLAPTAYRLEIEARRQSGGRLVLGLVRDGRQIPVVLESAVVGSLAAPEDAAAREISERLGFTGGPPNTYTCIVTPEGVLVAFENRIRLVVGPDDESPFDDDWRIPGRDALFIGTHYSVYQFHRLTLTPIQL